MPPRRDEAAPRLATEGTADSASDVDDVSTTVAPDTGADLGVVYTGASRNANTRRNKWARQGQARLAAHRARKVRELDAEGAERPATALLELGVGKATPWTGRDQ